VIATKDARLRMCILPPTRLVIVYPMNENFLAL
jgi:hypothetical protein